MISESLLNDRINKIISNKHIISTVMRVESGDGSFVWTGARGDMQPNDKYFIASVTKLYVTAVVIFLTEQGKLDLDEKISEYLPTRYTDKLHILGSVDYSDEITVKHLISNTSGIPDYFFIGKTIKTCLTPCFKE